MKAFGGAAATRVGAMTAHHCLKFGEFTLDLDRGALSRRGVELSLRPKSFAVLKYLVDNPGRLISKDELLSAVWGRVVVTEGTLTQCLIDIRRVLDDRAQSIVRTVRGRGVRFELPVTTVVGNPAAAEQMHAATSPPASATETRSHSPNLHWRHAAAALSAALVIAVTSAAVLGGGTPAPGSIGTEAPSDTPDRPPAADAASATHKSPSPDPLLVQARYLFNRRGSGDLERAVELLERVLDASPASAEAWTVLAAIHGVRLANPGVDFAATLARSRNAAEQALALDPQSAEALVRLARVHAYEGDTGKAAELRAQARALDPGHPLVLAVDAGAAAREGQLEMAIALQRRAVAADPLAFVPQVNLSIFLLAAGQVAEAEQLLREALVLYPAAESGGHRAEHLLVDALILQRRFQEARAVALGWPEGGARWRAHALILAGEGMRELAVAALRGLVVSDTWREALWVAEVHAARGDADLAARWIRSATEMANGTLQLRGLSSELALSPFLKGVSERPQVVRVAAVGVETATSRNGAANPGVPAGTSD